jgi:hypothetical protein
LEQDLATHDSAGQPQMTHDGERNGGFAATRFPDEAMRFTAPQRETEIDHRRYLTGPTRVGDR